ncbi:MAG TPA: FAD-dependent oxidoreductase [Thermoanaerobaculia bacterium]
MHKAENFDVVVIGGGTAGLVTASGCARLGRRVALIERTALGGDCLWTGCVPTKALVSSARLADQMRHADAWGITPAEPRMTPAAVMASMRERRRTISRHDDPQKFRDLGIDVITGSAQFVSSSEVEVRGTEVPLRRLRAKDIVIATGARTNVPPVEGLQEAGFLDHASFLEQDAIPPSILVLGGGAIGIEFAQMFSRFGSRVTVVEAAPEILLKEDAEMVERVRNVLTAERIKILAGWSAKSVRRDGEGRIVRIETASGDSRELTVDQIFVASGRRGNTDGLALERAGVSLNGSWVTVNRFLQTSSRRVWACGDVHGGLQFTHVAAYEAVKLVRNMLFPGKSAVDYDNIPWTLYTDPELAHVGMTEEEARAAHGDDVRVFSTEMADVDRAVVDRSESGMIKLVCNRKGRILGAHLLCSNASTVIQEIVLARRKGLRIGDLAQRISSYPSLADGVQKAASQFYGELATSWPGRLARRVAAITQ